MKFTPPKDLTELLLRNLRTRPVASKVGCPDRDRPSAGISIVSAYEGKPADQVSRRNLSIVHARANGIYNHVVTVRPKYVAPEVFFEEFKTKLPKLLHCGAYINQMAKEKAILQLEQEGALYGITRPADTYSVLLYTHITSLDQFCNVTGLAVSDTFPGNALALTNQTAEAFKTAYSNRVKINHVKPQVTSIPIRHAEMQDYKMMQLNPRDRDED